MSRCLHSLRPLRNYCLKTSLTQLENTTSHANIKLRYCHSKLTPLSKTTPIACRHSALFMMKSPQALCLPFCETLGANLILPLELDSEDDDEPASLWTSSVLKKRRKKMNKHKYKKRKRRDRYKTKLT